MTERCTYEEKQHMIELTREFRDIVTNLPNADKKPLDERLQIVNRLGEIKNEMRYFRARYPDD